MYLTISKKFEFSASQRYYNPKLSEKKNLEIFGRAAEAKRGFGQNYTAHFVFHGPVNRENGMVINVTDIKERAGQIINESFDHKFLNADSPPFNEIPPTPENIAPNLLSRVTEMFKGESAQPVACHLVVDDRRESTAYADGHVESHFSLDFSAARRTWSPHLSDQENADLFGIASSPHGHGHNYRLRATLGGNVSTDTGMIVPDIEVQNKLDDIYKLLDHRNLNTEVEDLKDVPKTTEYLSRYLYTRLAAHLPVTRVRLHEREDFFAEYLGDNNFAMGITASFNAAHRLHSPFLSDSDNRKLYGKCNNPRGHGHLYRVEATMGGEYSERSGTLMSLTEAREGLDNARSPWHYRHLNEDTDDFKDMVTTSENIVELLWRRVDESVKGALIRLRLWETPNNRFTLRRNI